MADDNKNFLSTFTSALTCVINKHWWTWWKSFAFEMNDSLIKKHRGIVIFIWVWICEFFENGTTFCILITLLKNSRRDALLLNGLFNTWIWIVDNSWPVVVPAYLGQAASHNRPNKRRQTERNEPRWGATYRDWNASAAKKRIVDGNFSQTSSHVLESSQRFWAPNTVSFLSISFAVWVAYLHFYDSATR